MKIIAPSEPPDLVIIGQVAYNQDITQYGTKVSPGGSAYYCAVGAAAVNGIRLGVVATIAPDFELSAFSSLGIMTDGIVVEPDGMTARFTIVQQPDGSRQFAAPEWGVANNLHFEQFPDSFWHAKHIHFCTSPPEYQRAWIEMLRWGGFTAPISVDLFEHFVRSSPQECRLVSDMADMVFMNEEEAVLFEDIVIAKPHMITFGPGGARYVNGEGVFRALAPAVTAVDTTGAGEIVAGAFLSQRVRGVSKSTALMRAVELATRSITSFGVDHLRS